MKKIYSTVAAFMLAISVFAQAPEKMSYQAVIRNSSNVLVTSAPIGMQISILQGSATGTVVYAETQTTTTNANGLASLQIGAGTVTTGTFATIDWSTGPYFIKTETDPTGGTAYSITGTSQLLSVPYALYAKTSGSSLPGPTGATGANGLKSLVKTTAVASGTDCANGGTKVESGVDTNNDGTLQASEVTATQFVCNGTNGSNGTNGTNGLKSLVKTTAVASGTDCVNGGTKVESGVDTNNDGTLQVGEVTATQFVCNGTNGSNGTNGTNGLKSLVKTTAIASGTDCVNGGTKVESGIDTNNDGTLQVGEVTATQFVCNGTNGSNGTNGTNGLKSLVKTTAVASGTDCANGGTKVETGIDTNNDGTLQAGEVTATQFVCNGTNGSNGTNGTNGLKSLVKTTAIASGTDCVNGGTKVESGIDTNNDGTLQVGEVTATQFVCNGTNGSNGTNGTNGLKSLVKTTAVASGTDCANGGTKVETGIDTNNDGTLQAGEVTATQFVCNGTNGSNGTNGNNGQGVPTGGTANQVLTKIDGTNYNTQWVTPASGGGASLQLDVTKTAAETQTTAVGYSLTIPAGITFGSSNGTNASLTGGNTWTRNTTYLDATTPPNGNNVFTVGASGAGLYLIDISLVGNIVSCAPMIDVNGTGNSGTSIYGMGVLYSTGQSPHKGRGHLTATIYLNAADFIVIRGLPTSTVIGSDLSTDGSTYLRIIKMN